jgi:hypothetical protein
LAYAIYISFGLVLAGPAAEPRLNFYRNRVLVPFVWMAFAVPDSFYRTVDNVASRGRPPRAPESITPTPPPISDGRLLSLDDETDLAEHIAFLAQTQDGADDVSAAMVEEHGSSLVVKVASNSPMPQEVMDGFNRLFDRLRAYAREGKFNHHPFLVTLNCSIANAGVMT